MKRTSMVLVAYQCAPDAGSVSQIGWEWYRQLREHTDLTLLTHVRNRTALQAAGAGAEVQYIDTEWFAGPWHRLARRLFPASEHSVFLLSSLDYFLFDVAAALSLRRQLRSGRRWQLIHRVTPVTVAAPTLLGRLGVPLVLGPLNCGLGQPAGFADLWRREGMWLTRLRRLGHGLDRVLGSCRSAALIMTATRHARTAVPAPQRSRCVALCENGVNLDRFPATPWPPAPRTGAGGTALEVLFVGRLIALKGVDMLLRAIATLAADDLPVRLTVAGSGPLEQEWSALADQLGLAGQVRFLGARSAAQVAAAMADCHVLCLPSVRESGGAVLLEAMACARPVLALDYGGPSDLVDEQVGLLVPLNTPQQVAGALAAALRDIFARPAVWRERGRTGRLRAVSTYTWPAKIEQALAAYQPLLKETSHHAGR